MTQHVLEAPVVVGDVTMAPTTELAGLADLARVESLDERIAVLARVAEALRGEDEIRDHIADLRDADELAPLPHRR
jgi:hypothetical protein